MDGRQPDSLRRNGGSGQPVFCPECRERRARSIDHEHEAFLSSSEATRMPDLHLVCVACGAAFTHREANQRWFGPT